MHHLLTLAKVAILLAFLFVNPLIVGSVYIGLLVLRQSAKSISNPHDRFWAMLIAVLFIAFITPLFFASFPGITICALFAGVLMWVFFPLDKRHVKQYKRDERVFSDHEDDIIDVEVVSSRTVYPDEP